MSQTLRTDHDATASSSEKLRSGVMPPSPAPTRITSSPTRTMCSCRFGPSGVVESTSTRSPSRPRPRGMNPLLRAALVEVPDAANEKLVYRYRWHADSLTMNGGSDSLLAAINEGILISEIYSDLPTTIPADRLTLMAWRRELQATAFMAHVVQRRPIRGLELAQRAFHDDPKWMIDLARCGTLAAGRRSRTAFRTFLARFTG